MIFSSLDVTDLEKNALRGDFTYNLRRHVETHLTNSRTSGRNRVSRPVGDGDNDFQRTFKADKGATTVVMDRDVYNEKLKDMLGDTATYNRLQRDPTPCIEREANQLVDRLCREGVLSETEKAPFSALARWASGVLKPVAAMSAFRVRNSFDLKERLSQVVPEEGFILVSLDVESMYTSIPHDLAMAAVDRFWDDIKRSTPNLDYYTFRRILRFLLENEYFKHEDFWIQRVGLPMGHPTSTFLADLVMDVCFTEVLQAFDDHIQFSAKFNNYAPGQLVFTIERESGMHLNFLDVRDVDVRGRCPGVGMEFDHYTKPTDSGRLIHFLSFHTTSMKHNIANMFARRVLTLSDPVFHRQQRKTIRRVLRRNGYTRRVIDRAIFRFYHPRPERQNDNANTSRWFPK